MEHCDLIIVGAGVMGVAHAYHAARAGMSVRVFDRSPSAQGASIRNFGMLAVVAQSAGRQKNDARRSLKHWQYIGSEAGFDVQQSGGLILAKHPEELAVLQEFAKTTENNTKLLSRTQLDGYAKNLRIDNLIGGLWSNEAWKVDQRRTINQIASWLQQSFSVEFHFSTSVDEIVMPAVQTSSGEYSCNTVVVCTGNEFSTLFADSFTGSGVTQCELQMLRTQPQPMNWQLKPFLLGGLSIPRYSAFKDCESLADLKLMQEEKYSKHLEHGIHVLACQEADGSITIGDSHHYSDKLRSERSFEIDNLIKDELESMITLPHAQISERWTGHYAYLSNCEVLTLSPSDNVMAVIATHGQGMTHAFAIAEDVIHNMSH